MSTSSSGVAIPGPAEPSDHLHLGSLTIPLHHGERVHDRLDEPQAAAAVVPTWLPPAAEVPDGYRDLAFRQGRLHLDRAVPRTICVLDRIRKRLVAGEDDVVALFIVRFAGSQPAPQLAPQGSKREGVGGQGQLEGSRHNLERLEGEQRDVIFPPAYRRKQTVAEGFQVVVPLAHRTRKAREAV